MKKNIIVGQSGYPTAVINASLCGVIREGKCHPEQIGTVYGMINGSKDFWPVNIWILIRAERGGTGA